MPPAGQDDPNSHSWLMLHAARAGAHVGLPGQGSKELPASTWPGSTSSPSSCTWISPCPPPTPWAVQRAHALDLGARLLLDQSDDPDEPIYVYADPRRPPLLHLRLPGLSSGKEL